MSFISRQDDSLVIKLCQIKIKIRIKNEKISNIIFEDKKYIDAKCVNLPIVKSTKDNGNFVPISSTLSQVDALNFFESVSTNSSNVYTFFFRSISKL